MLSKKLVSLLLVFANLAVGLAVTQSPAGAAGDVVPACSFSVNAADVDVFWTPITGVDKYVIRRTVNGGALGHTGSVTGAAMSTFSDNLPTPTDATMTYTVESKTGTAYGPQTGCADVTADDYVPECWFHSESNSVEVGWTPIAGVDKYVIRRTVNGGALGHTGSVTGASMSAFSDNLPTPSDADLTYTVESKTGTVYGPQTGCTDIGACRFTVLPSDEISVGWEDFPGPATVEIFRSTNGGAMTSIHTATANDREYIDPTIPPAGATMAYEVLSEGVTATCEELPYVTGIDAASLGLDIDANGEIQGEGAGGGSAPVAVDVVPPEQSSLTAAEAADVCSAHLRMNLPKANGTRVWTKITIPAGQTLKLDGINRKEVITGGNWSGWLETWTIDTDGTPGSRVGTRAAIAPGYHWSSNEKAQRNLNLLTNNGVTKDYFLTFRLVATSGVPSSEGASFFTENIRFLDSNGDLSGRPCDAQDIQNCRDSATDPLFASDDFISDGTTYDNGCYEYESCLSEHLGGWRVPFENWICNNDDVIRDVVIAGGAVILIGGLLYFGLPALTAVVSTGAVGTVAVATVGGTTGLAISAGEAALLLGLLTTTVVVAGQNFEVPVFPDLEIPTTVPGISVEDIVSGIETLTQLDPPSWTLDTTTGTSTLVAGVILENAIYNRGSFEDNLRDDDSTPVRDRARRFAKHAISLCVTSFTADKALEVMGALFPGQTHVKFIVQVDGSSRHLCEFISIYGPAGRTWSGLVPMAEQTLHIGEVVYGADAHIIVDHTGDQPLPPQRQWHFLNQESGKPNSRWYRRVQFGCVATVPHACDEWPWKSTVQGGDPAKTGTLQPHLRIMTGAQNSAGGSDKDSFITGCSVANSELFMVVPAPKHLMVTNWSPPAGQYIELVPSQRFCGEPV